MKKLCQFASLDEAEILKSILTSENIEIHIKHKNIQDITGKIPFTDTLPEIWVINDSDYDKAKIILDDFLKPVDETNLTEWKCSSCNEINEKQYNVCWKCGIKIQN